MPKKSVRYYNKEKIPEKKKSLLKPNMRHRTIFFTFLQFTLTLNVPDEAKSPR
jgi:hypothetical protein